MFEFKLPEVGENITSGTVVSIAVSVGDPVTKDQDLFELETDKATIPVPSPVDGVVKEILIKEGEDVAIGSVVMKFDGEPDSLNKSGGQPEGSVGRAEARKTAESAPVPQPAVRPTVQPAAQQPVEEESLNPDQHVVVIGGGPGGYTAAFHAADLGLKVTIVELDKNPGGVCLYRGCMPSKALLHAAKIKSDAKEAGDIGLEFGDPKIDLNKLRSWKNQVVEQLTGGLGQLSKQRKVTFIQGRAAFLDSSTLEIEKADGSKDKLSFDKAILATGSRPIMIDAWPESDRILDSTGALEIENIPKSMLVVGGGVIGLELGTVYAEFGTEIDVVEMLPQLIPGADKDVVQVLKKRLDVIFNAIMCETKVTAMAEVKDGIKVSFEDKDGKASENAYEKVLVSIGRKPNSENLGLENTGVQLDDKGFVKTNPQQQTDDPNIYAIGDLIGQPMLAHKASHEGIVAAEVILGKRSAFEPRTIPGVVYTDPEVAWCGLTETEAKEKGISYEVHKFPWAASGRAITMARTDGLTKILIDPQTEIILGVSIVGPGAGELIAEGVVAIEMGATAKDLKMCIHPHPTTSETLMEAAESFYGLATHIYRPKKK